MVIRDSAQAMRQEGSAWFETTLWNVVISARDGASSEAADALERLCRTYWYPLYAYVRQQGYDVPQAEDLTQGFFAEFIRKFPDFDLSPDKGKFRTYLLACLTRFLQKDWQRSPESSERVIPAEELEQATAADWLRQSVDDPPERVFDVVWANTLVQKALDSLREEYSSLRKTALHARLSPLLTGRSADGAYATMAAELQMSEGALRVAAHEFRRRFGQLLRAEVAQTVPRPEDADEELRYLLSLWGANRSADQNNT